MKRVIVILLVLVVVLGASVAGYQLLNPKPYDIADDPEVEVIEIRRDTILTTVNATGRSEAAEEVNLNFQASGVVSEVAVDPGQTVSRGYVLARLQPDEMELAVERAESDLARAQAQLDQLYQPAEDEDVAAARAELARAEAQLDDLYQPPSVSDIESAEAAVESAQASLERVLEGLDENEITVAAANLRKAEIILQQAQWEYDQVSYLGEAGATPQAAQLEQATIDYETAKANYLLAVKDADEADIAAAGAQLAQAEASLAKLLEDPTALDIASAQAQKAQAEASLASLLKDPAQLEVAIAQTAVDAAQVGLDQARLNLVRSMLVAPLDGVVTEVNLKVGESPTTIAGDNVGGRAAVVIADMSAFHLTVEIDEIDISRIEPGQHVTILVDAVPDTAFEGHVSAIAPGPAESSATGIVAYEVTIDLDSDGTRLLPGMTADATIETDRLEDVLVVPNRAVSIDRESGLPVTSVETVDEQGNPTRVEIELGLRNETVSEVLTGLEEGDQVIIGSQSRREQLRRAFQGGE
jgi:HlyD family secretion protein